MQKAWRRNYESFNLKDAAEKIKTFVKRTGIDKDEVEAKIRNDTLFRWCFVKDPKRQNFYEDLAAEHIKGLGGVRNFVRLPNSAKSICSGLVMDRDELKKRGGNPKAKTIDFEWETGRYRVYASHKYTNESGGAQDNQYKDLHEFIKEANESNSADSVFVAIADGAYYDTRNEIRGLSKIQSLKRSADGRRVFACTIDELPEVLAALQP